MDFKCDFKVLFLKKFQSTATADCCKRALIRFQIMNFRMSDPYRKTVAGSGPPRPACFCLSFILRGLYFPQGWGGFFFCIFTYFKHLFIFSFFLSGQKHWKSSKALSLTSPKGDGLQTVRLSVLIAAFDGI